MATHNGIFTDEHIESVWQEKPIMQAHMSKENFEKLHFCNHVSDEINYQSHLGLRHHLITIYKDATEKEIYYGPAIKTMSDAEDLMWLIKHLNEKINQQQNNKGSFFEKVKKLWLFVVNLVKKWGKR